ncbi:MAG: hypothetical protein DRI92_01140 [Aquificota bacterium]|nr:MAG: hypothetical protein DRI92_01140 [Aquificota bacterium]
MSEGKQDKFAKALEELWGDELREVKDYIKDFLTLTITTKVKREGSEGEEEVARTSFYLDGDIECLFPLKGGAVDREILALHQDMVEMAMANRTEIVKTLLGLLKLIDLTHL